MRRTILALVVVVIAVLAFPVIGTGEPTVSHGGPPSDVYTSTDPEVCHDRELRAHPVKLIPTAVTVDETSLVVAYFTATIARRAETPELLLGFQIKGTDFLESSEEWIQRGGSGHEAVTVMWTFPSIVAGDYTVRATARMGGPLSDGPDAAVHTCSLTVFVVPVAA